VSTRAICDLAGVQAPTLYHHFDNKQGLLDAVVSHGFRQFLKVRRSIGSSPDDPIADIREGWDSHVMFGLEHPTFYAHVYGNVKAGVPCGVIAEVEEMILETLQAAARQGRLVVTPRAAAEEIVAASSGVILTLIQQATGDVDLELSHRVRDAILDNIAPAPGGDDDGTGTRSVAAAAIALTAALEETPPAFSDTETALLRDWLSQLATR
jgi:AcrR family transcriptional regulator